MARPEQSQATKKRKLLREHVYTGVKTAIIGGDFQPGKRLIEEKLAADMATSRTPVREAIQKLEKEGLIFRLPRGGFAVKQVTEEELEEILGLRSILEGYAAFLATSRITETELKQLDEIITKEDACLKNLNVDEFIRLDGEFHDVLYRAAKNARLYGLLNDLRDYMYRYRVIILHYQRKLHLAVQDHKEMLASIKAKSPRQVEKLVRKHVSRGKEIIKKKIKQGEQARVW
ncbi:MAG TPA: GntR family transcriptional regulator [Syntrophorhabdales bacterium]|nr:GntR family transcriptional regulator [Syntrophorhabdales bacterium]